MRRCDRSQQAYLGMFRELLGVEITLPLPRLTWRERGSASARRPDLRFGMELIDISILFRTANSNLPAALADGGSVHDQRSRRRDMTRREIDSLTDFVRRIARKVWPGWRSAKRCADASWLSMTTSSPRSRNEHQPVMTIFTLIVADETDVVFDARSAALRGCPPDESGAR